MPDFSPQDSNPPQQLPQQQQPLPKSTDPFSQFVQDGQKNLPTWMNPQSIQMQIPYKTRLDQTLRYTDPNLGFTPLDPNLEDEYANAHPFKTFGNNILQSGARFVGAGLEAVATIPLLFNAAASGDLSKTYDNSFTTGINDFLKTLDVKLPVYQTNYERDHPILKYLNVLKPTSFFDATGSVVNNLGFMAGAIAGSFVEDAAITALTGGAGFFPALASNIANITKIARASRALAEAPEEILDATGLAKTAENIATDLPAISSPDAVLAGGTTQAVRSTSENLVSQDVNAADILASQKTKELKQAIVNNANYYQIRDGVKYNLALLSSGMSIGAFQAVDVYNKGLDQLNQEYLDLNGKVAQGDDLRDIQKVSKQSANITMGANVAFAYLTSRLNFGSLFKPTQQAFDETISGFGAGITRDKVVRTALDEANNFKYVVTSQAPETTLGKILLNGEKLLRKSVVVGGEGAQFAAMGAISDASLDYNLRKYDAESRGGVVNYMDSFLKGIDKTYNSNEGLSNIMLGLVMGAFGTPLLHKITGEKSLATKDQLNNTADLLNNTSFKDVMEQKIQEASVQTSLGLEHKDAAEAKDSYKAHNIRFDMLFNWVTSGLKTNTYNARVEELDAVRNLKDKSFESYWHLEDNDTNRAQINEFLDNIQRKANNIKDNYTKIDKLTKNPYSSKESPQDYEAYESYKDQLALYLSRSEDTQERLRDVTNKLSELSPGLDIQKAVDVTSIGGIRNIARKLSKTIDDLGFQMKDAKEAGTDEETMNSMFQQHQHLSKLFSDVQEMLNNTTSDKHGNILESGFDGKKFTDVLQKLYDLHIGASYTSNKFLTDQQLINEDKTIDLAGRPSVNDLDELSTALQNLQDIYKLSKDNLGVQRMYNYLRQGVGATDFTERLKAAALANLEKFKTPEGEFKSPEAIKTDIEEEKRFAMGEPSDIEEATKQERDIIRTAAKKVVKGEQLTPEEEQLKESKPSRFANEVKIQTATEQEVQERFGETGEPPAEEEEKPREIGYGDVFGMYSPSKNFAPQRKNLYNAIFKLGDVFNKLSAKYEALEPPVISYANLPKTGLFRSTFKENIHILHNGEPVGILRPADSLWLDDEGKRSIYDMQPEEYTKYTGNNANTYEEFMDSIRAYQDAYNKLKDALANGKELTYKEINKYFDLSINTGISNQNRYVIEQNGRFYDVKDPNGVTVKRSITRKGSEDWIQANNNKLSRFDTLLKDLNYKPKGTAIVSFIDRIVSAGKGEQVVKKSEPVIANAEELTPAQLAKLQTLLDTEADFLKQNANRYIVVVPIGNEYLRKGILFARNADTTTEDKSSYFDIIKQAANGLLSVDKLNDVIGELNDKYFLSNINRAIKQTFITTSFYEDGDFLLKINNPSLKVYKDIRIPKEDIQNIKTYGDFINKLQNEIDSEALKDKGFASLRVELSEDSLKRQIPKDEKINSISQVEDTVKVATNADVFKNYNINFSPKSEAAAEEVAGGAPKPPSGGLPPKPAPVEATLPDDLSKAKPRYGYKDKNFKLKFHNDIDKAAYITAQATKSPRDADYLKFVMDATGLSEKQVRSLGIDVRDIIKGIAQDLEDETINVPQVFNTTTKGAQAVLKGAPKPEVDNINKEYIQKRHELNQEFNNSLTPAEIAIKKALQADDSLSGEALLKAANATQADLESYSAKAHEYNEKFSVYKSIQQQKIDDLTTVSKPVFAKTKAGIEVIAKDLFNLPDEQAKAIAEIYDQNAKAWAAKTGKPVDEYYKQLGFKSKLDQPTTNDNILEQYPAIQKVIDYLKLQPKKLSVNKTGYVSENGSVGLKLADRIGEVIKEQNLQDLVGARWNKTDGAIEFYPLDKQGVLFQNGEEQKNQEDSEIFTPEDHQTLQKYIDVYKDYKYHLYGDRNPEEEQNIANKVKNGEFINDNEKLTMARFLHSIQSYNKEDLNKLNSLESKFSDLLEPIYLKTLIEKKNFVQDPNHQLTADNAKEWFNFLLNIPKELDNPQASSIRNDFVKENGWTKEYLISRQDYTDAHTKEFIKIAKELIGKELYNEFKKTKHNLSREFPDKQNELKIYHLANNLTEEAQYAKGNRLIQQKYEEDKDVQNDISNLWHGSPHRHEGFNTDYIGSGEGAQVWGWGIYLTSSRNLAENKYAKIDDKIYHNMNSEAGKIQNELYDLLSSGIYERFNWRKVNEYYDKIEQGINTTVEKLNNIEGIDKKYLKVFEQEAKIALDKLRSNEYVTDNRTIRQLQSDYGYSPKEAAFSNALFESDLQRLVQDTNVVNKLYGIEPQSTLYNVDISGAKLLEFNKPIPVDEINTLFKDKLFAKAALEYANKFDEAKYKNTEELKKAFIDNKAQGNLIYKILSKHFADNNEENVRSDQQAAEYLDKTFGYKGHRYISGEMINTNSYGYVMYDGDAIKIKDRILFQKTKAAYDKLTNTIYALTNPDVTSPLHELAHSWEQHLNTDEQKQVLDWAKTDTWTRETSEKFASGFELYMAEGKAPKGLKGLFDTFAQWLTGVVQKVKALFGNDFALNDQMRDIYAKMLNSEHIKPVEEPIEIGKEIGQLHPDKNIDFDTNLSGQEYYYLTDNNGNKLDKNTYDTFDKATVALNELNTKNGFPIKKSVQQAKNEAFNKFVEIKPEQLTTKQVDNNIEVLYNNETLGSVTKTNTGYFENLPTGKITFIGDDINEVKKVLVERYNNNKFKELNDNIEKNITEETVNPTNKPTLTNDNIQYKENEDGSSNIVIVDNDGNTIKNPNTEDGTFKLQEAKDFIKEYNSKLAEQPKAEEQKTPQQLFEEAKQQGKLGIFSSMSPEDALKTIGQQALNVDEFGNPHKTSSEETNTKTLEKTLSPELVQAAKDYYKSLPKPEPSAHITEPLTEDGKTDYAKISQIQKDLNPDGYYEQEIKTGRLTVDQVKEIIKSAGLKEDYVDGIKFRIDNPDLIKSLKEGIPKGINITYLRSDLDKAIKDGRFGEAIRNGDVLPEKAKEILKYFHVNENKFKEDFDAIEQKNKEAIAEQLHNETPLTDEESAFINTLKKNIKNVKGKGASDLKDLLDVENYQGALDYLKNFTTDSETAKKLFNNPDTLSEYVKLTGAKEPEPTPDIIEPEPKQQKEKEQYVKYKERVGDTTVDKYGKVIGTEGLLSTIQDVHGKTIERLTDSLKPANKADFDAQKTHVPTAKYAVGDKVVYGADKQVYTILDSEQRLRETKKNEPIYDIFYTTEEGPLISESGIQGLARITGPKKEFRLRVEDARRLKTLQNIVAKFETLFPQIKADFNYYDWDAPARFNKGRVEINLNHKDLKRESVAHEFIHPFIVALQESNSILYGSLVKEISNNKTIMDSVDALIKKGVYNEDERINEALAVYLGKSITNAFNKDGTLNLDYVNKRKNSLIARFAKWMQDILNFLTGKKKVPTLEEFIKRANSDASAQKENIRRAIKSIPELNDIYEKEHGRDITKTIAYIKRSLGDAMNSDGSLNEDKFKEGETRLAEKLGIQQGTTKQELSPKEYAEKLSKMSSDELLDLDIYENYKGYSLFEAYKIMPKTDNTTKFKKVPEDNRGLEDYEYIANIEGVPYGLTKQEDPDEPDNKKAFVWSYERLDGNYPDHDTFITNNADLVNEIKSTHSEPERVKKPTPAKHSIGQKDLSGLMDIVSDYLQQKPTGRFEFIERPNINSGVEFDESDPDRIKVYIDPMFANDVAAPSTLLKYADPDVTSGRIGLTDNEAASEFKKLVERNYYKAGSNKAIEPQIGVNNINPLMKLQDISDYIIKGLNDQDTQLVYNSDELKYIDELTAYMHLDDEDAKRIRERIVKRLNQLNDTATTRLNNETLKQNYKILHNLNLDENDKDFIIKYVEQGAASINLAWIKFNDLRQDLKGLDEIADPAIQKAKLNRLNKDLDVIKQLTSFYDDFNNLYNTYDDEFSSEDIARFYKATNNLNRLRADMNETSINLAVKWFMPYVEKHNEFIAKEGYTDPKYQLTEKDLYDNLKYGTTKDTNFVTFNLGATVTSRDPINAVFGNIVADMLSVNNVNIVNDSFDINEGYDKFLKAKGLSVNNTKAHEKYYKENYLRKADILVTEYDDATESYVDRYIQKSALHQEFYYDKYAKDLALQKEKYKNPRNSEEADTFREQLHNWILDNKNGKSEKYRNHAYTALKDDPFFKLLEKHYNNANEKYGEFKLLYGIIPQKYSRNFIQKTLDSINEAKSEKTLKDKINTFGDKAKLRLAGIRKDQTSENLDKTTHRTINSNLNKLKSDDNIDYNLHSSIIDFVTEATNYGSLKEVQYNAENLRMLIEGNYKFSIPGRKIGKEDFEAKIRQPIQLRKAKERLAQLQELKDAGQPYDEEVYKKLSDKVAKGIQSFSLWDKFAGTVKPSETNRLNEQLRQFINDSFYGESVEEAKLGSISLNRAAHYISMYTSINNMALNTVAGVSNVIIGNVQMLIEGHGGKYYNKAELAKASADYVKNIPQYIQDLKNPIKSKDTQLSFLLDAIQGEVLDEFGKRISGNIAKRMFDTSSLFFFTSVGEHQIQITGMKAMLLGKKVTTTSGEIISLYDAFIRNENGRYTLRTDLKDFNADDLQHFIRQLHSVNRSLNGNYSALHKGTLQRKWYGTLMLKFRKYIYEAFRTRYASEHQDYEKNTVETGYLNFFFKDYLYKNVKGLLLRQATDFKGENLLPNQKYALRKATIEVGVYASISLIIAGLFGGNEKKDLSPTQKAMLLYGLRLRNDLGMYHLSMPSEAKQQIQNPTASLTTSMALLNTLGQLLHPSETYTIDSNGHKKGDNKLLYDVKKLTPGLSKFPINIDNKLSYFNLVNQNVTGIKRSQNAQ